MDGPQALDACLVESLHGSYPQLKVGVDGVLDEDGHIDSSQRIGQGLHGKGVGRGARPYPQDVHAVLQCQLDVLWRGHFGRDEHVGFFLYLLHPWQGFLAVALEATGLGTGFPYAGPEVMASFHGQLACRVHHLFLSLGTAGACNDEGTFVVARKIEWL